MQGTVSFLIIPNLSYEEENEDDHHQTITATTATTRSTTSEDVEDEVDPDTINNTNSNNVVDNEKGVDLTIVKCNDVDRTLIVTDATDSTAMRPPFGMVKPAPTKLMHIRALFNYVPQEDLYIPCKELGLAFNKGDILHVIGRQDGDWWQAYSDQDKDQSLAGLIPSQAFQEKYLIFSSNRFCIKSYRRFSQWFYFQFLKGDSLKCKF